MVDFTKTPDAELFTASEQIGSEAAYHRDLEIRRRQFVTEKLVAESQIAAADAQKVAADATVRTAFWTMTSAILVAVTVIVSALGLWLQSGN